MTQKRFKKLLMSEGFSRNAVNSIIEKNKQNKKPWEYERVYNYYRALTKISIKGLAEAVGKTIQAMARLSNACVKAVEAFNIGLRGGSQ